MKKQFFFTVILSLLFSVGLKAQTQLELNEQSYNKYKKADTELNTVYKKLMALTDKTDKPLLIAAQREWIKYRDAHCKFEEKLYEGGSIRPLIYNDCLADITKNRIAILKTSLKERSN